MCLCILHRWFLDYFYVIVWRSMPFNIVFRTWMIGQFCILSKSEGYTKLGGVVDTPDDGAVIQVSLSGLVKWAVISRGKCQVLHLRRSSLRHQNMQGLTG